MTTPGPLVTLGETLAVLRADRPGLLGHGQALRLSVAGSESNVAIGVSRLGHPATFIGRVGADSLGALVRSSLLGAGVAADLPVDQIRPTGLMLVEQRLHDVRRVHYYRTGSAGSALTPEDVDPDAVARAGLLHVTGITRVLSQTAAAAVEAAVNHARANAVPVSLDLNYRAALATPAQFRTQLAPLLDRTDVVFASLDEARLVLDLDQHSGPEDLLSGLRRSGAREVVLTDGRNGAWADAGEGTHRQLTMPVTAVDPIGAGDAFVAGYLAAHLQGAPIAQRLACAAQVAAICVATAGDWEGLPWADELRLLDLDHGAVSR